MTDPAANLERLVDDVPDADLVAWAEERWLAGDSPEAMTAALVQQGHPADVADRAVELARQQTRAARGVVTQNDVRQNVNRAYANNTRSGLGVAFPTIRAFRGLLTSLASFRWLRRFRNQTP